MEYWNSLLTEKSWNILQQLAAEPFKFTVIGGWGAYLWTRQQKSKDLDVVLESAQDLQYLKSMYGLKKNDNLRKYEILYGGIDIDVYVPYYSRLAIPPEELKKHVKTREGFSVPSPEALLILKQGAEENRSHTVKGLKDRVDIMSLIINTDFDFKQYHKLARQYNHPGYPKRLQQIVKAFRDGKYLNLNLRQLKQEKKKLVEKMTA